MILEPQEEIQENGERSTLAQDRHWNFWVEDPIEGYDDERYITEVNLPVRSWEDSYERPDGYKVTVFEPQFRYEYTEEMGVGDERVYEANEGRVFAFIFIGIDNTTSDTIETPNPLDFEVSQDEDRFEHMQDYHEDEAYDGLNDIEPEDSEVGFLVYDIPDNASSVSMIYENYPYDWEVTWEY